MTDRSEGDAFERTGRALYLFHRNKDSVVTPSREKWSKEKSNHCRMENPEKVESSSAQAPVVFAVLLIYPPPLDPSKTNHGM